MIKCSKYWLIIYVIGLAHAFIIAELEIWQPEYLKSSFKLLEPDVLIKLYGKLLICEWKVKENSRSFLRYTSEFYQGRVTNLLLNDYI